MMAIRTWLASYWSRYTHHWVFIGFNKFKYWGDDKAHIFLETWPIFRSAWVDAFLGLGLTVSGSDSYAKQKLQTLVPGYGADSDPIDGWTAYGDNQMKAEDYNQP